MRHLVAVSSETRTGTVLVTETDAKTQKVLLDINKSLGSFASPFEIVSLPLQTYNRAAIASHLTAISIPFPSHYLTSSSQFRPPNC